MLRFRPLTYSALVCLLASVSTAQTATFDVQVEGHPSMTFAADDLAKLPQHTIQVKEHDKTISYSGVLICDVLAQAGAPGGDKLRGKALSSYVLATAKDGYAVVYALPEFDPQFTDAQPLIATKADGQPLTETQGPYRIVLPQDKKPARSLRMLQRIEVVQLRK
jgi:hypothetical protein